jgi:large subunit ribosomal protein L19e
MPLKQQRMIAANLMKCGASRVRFVSEAEVAEALTREDIRALIAKGAIYKIQKKGTSRGHAREILRQKKRGRRRGPGSVKGKWGSRNPSKEAWMETIRPLRRMLRELRDAGQITRKDYRILYGKAKGGMFRSRKHMMLHLKEEELLKTGVTEKKIPSKDGQAKPAKKAKTTKAGNDSTKAKQVKEKSE